MPTEGRSARRVLVAVDIGGTFTDVVLLDASSRLQKAKILSSPPQYGRAVIDGMHVVLAAANVDATAIDALFHGMTVATNAILEGRGAVTALVTTKGFRDSLELARGRRPTMYDLLWEKPKPLVPRRLRFEAHQRITGTGELDPPVSVATVDAVAERLRAADVKSVAVSLLNSYLRPDEEQLLARELGSRLPGVLFTASVDISPEIGEYERASTAVVNAYVQPAVDSYLAVLEADLAALGMEAPFYVMQSSGGLVRSRTARRKPVHLIESGPAAGVTAVRALAREMGWKNVIAFDMGGTTAKASLIEDGIAFETSEYEVGAGMNAKRGLHVGAGYTVRTISLDIAEVGAGGGSIFGIDPGGSPRVGPRSAGAVPGPACYGAGGDEPTLSDAALLLGYLPAETIAGGTQKLRPDLAHASMAPIADLLSLSVRDAAYGAYRIAIANMTRLLKAVTSERGRDPRDSILVAFGGAGPAYAAALAAELGMDQVVIPAAAGLFSAIGLLASDPEHYDIRPHLRDDIDPDVISEVYAEMERETVASLVEDGYEPSRLELARTADMRYAGQHGLLRIPIRGGPIGRAEVALLLQRLDEEHLRTYGHHKAAESARIVNLRLRATVRRDRPNPLLALAASEPSLPAAEPRHRRAYFGAEFGLLETPVITRAELKGGTRRGPLIVEEMDTNVIIPPESEASLDRLGSIVITRVRGR